MKIMNRIKEHRERLGLSMAELAEKIGVDASTVCLWEQGKRIPKYASIKRKAGRKACRLMCRKRLTKHWK